MYGSGGTGASARPNDSKQIPNSLGILDEQINTTGSIVETLESLLFSVLDNNAIAKLSDGAGNAREVRAGLADTISSQANRICGINDRLRSLCERIQL